MNLNMTKSILFSFLLASSTWAVEGNSYGMSGQKAEHDERILVVGGELINPGDYPYFGKRIPSHRKFQSVRKV